MKFYFAIIGEIEADTLFDAIDQLSENGSAPFGKGLIMSKKKLLILNETTNDE